MFACTELVTGFDDFGKVIFLQSHCDRGASGLNGLQACTNCERSLRPAVTARRADTDAQSFDDVLRSLLNVPQHKTHVFPVR